ncbi:hypothetical protein AB9K26_00285 [Psychroserpens sp. XS_ASV72]|uniref:hypothetical protein n=1 Tax=Psychroserpens sp. XS_ASV72 TaxID=3241293 RepID=UPI00351878C0
MKIIVVSIFLSLSFFKIHSQEFLWSSIENGFANEKYIPIDNIPNELLSLYDQYNFSYILPKMEKKKFINSMNNSGVNMNIISWIDDLTFFAMQTKIENVPTIAIYSIEKNYIHLFFFSNESIDVGYYKVVQPNTSKVVLEKTIKTIIN